MVTVPAVRERCNKEIGDCEHWMDGDGFHYDVLTVPDECTMESLGIRWDCAEDDDLDEDVDNDFIGDW